MTRKQIPHERLFPRKTLSEKALNKNKTEKEKGWAIAYTDGSYDPSRQQGGWSMSLYIDNKEFKRACTQHPIKALSSAQMELMAYARAIKEAREQGHHLEIKTDFEGGRQQTLKLWEKTKENSSFQAKDTALRPTYQKLHAQLLLFRAAGLELKISKVKGHSGDIGNERAHRLALRAIRNSERETRKNTKQKAS